MSPANMIKRNLTLGGLVALCGTALPPTLAQNNSTPDQNIVIVSDTMTGNIGQNTLSASGNVQITKGSFVLQADQASYYVTSSVISAFGRVRLRGLGAATIGANRIQTTTNLANVFASDVSLSFGRGILRARRALATPDGEILLERVAATGCPECSSNGWPFWSVSARSARRDPQNKRIIFNHAILRVNGIPLAYVPGISFPSPEVKRASGFLLPGFGNSQVGPTVEIPYHLVLSPNQDVTVSAKLTGRSPISTINYRAHFDTVRVAFDGGLTYDPDPNEDFPDTNNRNWRGHIRGSAAFDLTHNWRLGTVFERQSDAIYDQRYAVERLQKATDRLYYGEPRNLLSQIYLAGSDTNYDFQAGAFSFQDIRATPATPNQPPVIPYIRTRSQIGLGKLGNAQVDTLAFTEQYSSPQTENQAYATARLSWIRQTQIGPGMILTPYMSARVDNAWMENKHNTSTQARYGASLSWPLTLKGRSGILIEPRAWIGANMKSGPTPQLPYWAATPGASSVDAPIHAGILTQAPIGYAGVDSRLSLGKSLLSLNAGRRWFADSEQDSIVAMNLTHKNSFLTARIILDNSLGVRETDVGITFNYGDLTGQLTWFVSSQQDRRGGQVRLDYRLDDNWSLTYVRQSNVTQSFDILETAEVVFNGACTVFKLSLRRSGITFGSITPNTTLGFSLAFKLPS